MLFFAPSGPDMTSGGVSPDGHLERRIKCAVVKTLSYGGYL